MKRNLEADGRFREVDFVTEYSQGRFDFKKFCPNVLPTLTKNIGV